MTTETPDYARMARDVVVTLAGCCDCDKLSPNADRDAALKHARDAKHFVFIEGRPQNEQE
jgi:hypothetical protein